jgi:hypothetical protein
MVARAKARATLKVKVLEREREMVVIQSRQEVVEVLQVGFLFLQLTRVRPSTPS